jgi:hypothetical protein
MTGWLVSLVGVRLEDGISRAADPHGRRAAATRVRVERNATAGLGEALAGFGAVLPRRSACCRMRSPSWPRRSTAALACGTAGRKAARATFLAGRHSSLTLLTQSSSAAIAIILSAAAGGVVGNRFRGRGGDRRERRHDVDGRARGASARRRRRSGWRSGTSRSTSSPAIDRARAPAGGARAACAGSRTCWTWGARRRRCWRCSTRCSMSSGCVLLLPLRGLARGSPRAAVPHGGREPRAAAVPRPHARVRRRPWRSGR